MKGVELLLDTDDDLLTQKKKCQSKAKLIVEEVMMSLSQKRDYRKYLKYKEQIASSITLYLFVRAIGKAGEEMSLKKATSNLKDLNRAINESASFFEGNRLDDLSKAFLASELDLDKEGFKKLQADMTQSCEYLSSAVKSTLTKKWKSSPNNRVLLDTLIQIAALLKAQGVVIGKGENSTFVYFVQILFDELQVEANAQYFVRDKVLPNLSN